MMKYVFVALMMVSSPVVYAEPIRIPNQEGGTMYFYEDHCTERFIEGVAEEGRKHFYNVDSTNSGGSVLISGCWIYVPGREQIVVIWHDGTRTIIDPNK